MGAGEDRGSCLFETVVRMSLSFRDGMCSDKRSRSSVMEASEDTGTESVDGKLRPGKEVKKTLRVDEAMLARRQRNDLMIRETQSQIFIN